MPEKYYSYTKIICEGVFIMAAAYKFAYYPGCTLSTTASELDRFARLSAEVLGFSLEEIESWQCCGAVFPLAIDETAPKLSVVRALCKAKEKNLALVTLCSACHHVFKQVNYQVRTDSGFREALRAYDDGNPLEYSGDVEVLHYMEVLRDYIGFDELKKKVANPLKGRKIGAYYGCMLLRPGEVLRFDDPENPSVFEEFLTALGAEPVRYPYRNECCGGYRTLKDKQKTQAMAERVISSPAGKGAGELITACPLCQYNIDALSGEKLPIYYFTEILAQALGVWNT